MSFTDPIADLLTRIRNANQKKLDSLELPSSKLKIQVIEILRSEGYIAGYDIVPEANNKKTLVISLKYHGDARERTINGLKRISKPGLRIYSAADTLPRVLGGLGIAIVSTSQGVFTDKVCRQKKIGGEVLAFVW
jgi:small subunit ribosomal protein S8